MTGSPVCWQTGWSEMQGLYGLHGQLADWPLTAPGRPFARGDSGALTGGARSPAGSQPPEPGRQHVGIWLSLAL